MIHGSVSAYGKFLELSKLYTSFRLAPANHTLQLANYSQASASCQSALSAECKTASKYELDSQQVG